MNKRSLTFILQRTLFWGCVIVFCLLWTIPTHAQDNCFFQWRENDDNDNDGLSDNFENCLATKHAPVLYLPLDLDWTLPTNVEWYLKRVTMRFNHDNSCSDCSIVETFPDDLSSAFATLISEHHNVKNFWCQHKEPVIYSDITKPDHWRDKHHFFLQVKNDDDHKGSSDPSDWKVYVHSYPTMQGVDIEYWYFFAYNDNIGTFNHEGDWEHITVRLDSNLAVFKVLYYAHGDPDEKNANEVEWLDGKIGEHPLIWIADGSHASYYRDGSECNSNWQEGSDKSCQTKDEYRWFTWSGGRSDLAGYQGFGIVQVGETMYPLNGQTWIKYSGRWGEVGETGDTSGPPGPSSQWGENQVSKEANPHDFKKLSIELILLINSISIILD